MVVIVVVSIGTPSGRVAASSCVNWPVLCEIFNTKPTYDALLPSLHQRRHDLKQLDASPPGTVLHLFPPSAGRRQASGLALVSGTTSVGVGNFPRAVNIHTNFTSWRTRTNGVQESRPYFSCFPFLTATVYI